MTASGHPVVSGDWYPYRDQQLRLLITELSRLLGGEGEMSLSRPIGAKIARYRSTSMGMAIFDLTVPDDLPNHSGGPPLGQLWLLGVPAAMRPKASSRSLR